ncbi:hypothetical protein PISL3812_05370 [Talaromyces islandicus]|uniref:Uncharacterized protein n=1 Tax=Talaromyces islandicus TaxID=28573 RepID=A0A0U1M041_TALIS|nr:hypothetical protein PISL3812_05370 [Talaromyces islandicus]
MPPNPPSDANDGSTTGSSKSSLLWAYQLRKEHIHLVNRIEDVNSDLLSCSSKATEHQQNLSNLERLVKSLQAENYSLKNEVTVVRDRFTASLDQVNKQVAAATSSGQEAKEESVAKLERDFEHMGLRVKELTQGMAELRMGMAGIEKKCECLAMKQMQFASWQAKTSPPKKPDTISETDGHGKQAGAGSFTQMTYPANEAAISTMTESMVPDSMRLHPAISPIDLILQQIKQDGRSLYEYFTFAAELRSELPRRKQEGHMVETFFDGLANDKTVKMEMEEYLDALGWIWGNVEGFCRHDLRGYNTRSRTRPSAAKKSRVESMARKETVAKDN